MSSNFSPWGMRRPGVALESRRNWLRACAAGVGFYSVSGWLGTLAAETAQNPGRHRSCILLWMSGGPSQLDTFDLKPGHENGGPFQDIETSVSEIRISEHLPKLAQQMQDVAIVRSMSTREGDHARATYLLRTGYLPQGPIRYPTVGSLLSKELGDDGGELPNFINIMPYRALSPAAYGPGFLGPQYAPLVVGGSVTPGGAAGNNYEQSLKVKNLEPPPAVDSHQAESRSRLLETMQTEFAADHPDVLIHSHREAYQKAVRMMRGKAAHAFELDEEPAELRAAYGENQFGQGCLLARRLVERGVPFVEVSLNNPDGTNGPGWDTHLDNFESVKRLSQVLDPAWATLISDLRTRGLLDSTLIVWMGEFGRTPKINSNTGRDHFPAAWTTVLSGGGIRGGQVIGKTEPDGMTVAERPVSVPDLLATVCKAVGVDSTTQNISNVGRPIRMVDPVAKPIEELLA